MRLLAVFAAFAGMGLGSVSALAEGPFIAGLTPDQRPADAPVIADFARDDDWRANALHGVEQPYPESLKFLDDQGAWFTPFIHPGMTGHFDIRGWHRPPADSSPN